MPILKNPGVYYDEVVEYELIGDGSKIPVIIGATGNQPVYAFTSYNNQDKEEVLGKGTVVATGVTSGGYSEVEVLTNDTNPDFIGMKYFVQSDANLDGETAYQLYSDAGSTGVGIYVTVLSQYAVDGSQVNKYVRWNDINKTPANGGVGVYTDDTDNELLITLHDFFEEADIETTEDIGVPYLYVVDVGDGTSADAWLNAFTNAKIKRDATLEAGVGFEKVAGDYTLMDLTRAFATSIHTETTGLNLRNGLVRLPTNEVEGNGTELGLVDYTNDTNDLRLDRVGLTEKLKFGKIVARFCCTPFYQEPGYFDYRSVEPGTFIERTDAEEKILQDAGIIFNRDEKIGADTHPKINLGVVSTFAKNPRPADSVFHARFIADELLKEVFKVLYPQVKNNESASNFVYCQSQINKVIDDFVKEGYVIKFNNAKGKGTKLTLYESDYNPYDIIVKGYIQPVNSTIAIMVQATVNVSTLKVLEGNVYV